MTDSLSNNSIRIVAEVIQKTGKLSENSSLWKWIAILEFGLIIFLLLKKTSKSKNSARKRFKEESLKEEIDFKNIINSSFNSVQLYDELKVKCHPDRFPDNQELNSIANNLFQEITKNKNNVKCLLELKDQAVQKLNIKFKN